MGEWWVVRDALRAEWLSLPEWQILLGSGHPWRLAPGERMSWGPGAGVLIMAEGQGQLATKEGGRFQLLSLRGGDAVGTLEATCAMLEAHTPMRGHLFCHLEWLCALQRAPKLTRKLLFGMAWSATDDELKPLGEREPEPQPIRI